MTEYIPRDGIILTQVCDIYILVSATRNREFCQRSLEINETAADIWTQICEHKADDEIEAFLFEKYENDQNINVHSMILDFKEEMCQRGYLIRKGDSDA